MNRPSAVAPASFSPSFSVAEPRAQHGKHGGAFKPARCRAAWCVKQVYDGSIVSRARWLMPVKQGYDAAMATMNDTAKQEFTAALDVSGAACPGAPQPLITRSLGGQTALLPRCSCAGQRVCASHRRRVPRQVDAARRRRRPGRVRRGPEPDVSHARLHMSSARGAAGGGAEGERGEHWQRGLALAAVHTRLSPVRTLLRAGTGWRRSGPSTASCRPL